MAKAKTSTAEETGEDQSMEEILQSIRKIIAEENDDPASEHDAGSETPPADEPEEEVLELTDAVQEDGSIVNIKSENDDVLANIDDALENAEAAEELEEAPPAPVAPPAPRRAAPVADENPEGLLSAASLAASAEALRALKAPQDMGGMTFLSGNTVEGLVQMMLRPMLKEWLDAHMPVIVQQAVERELKRITSNLDE